MVVGVVSAVGSHFVICISVCDWRTSKGLAKGEKREQQRYRERGTAGEGREGKGAGWPFFAEHRHSLCILAHSNLHTQYAAAVW